MFLKHYLYRIYRLWSGTIYRSRRRFTRGGFLVLGALTGALVLGVDTLFSMTYQALAFLMGLMTVSLAFAWFSRGRFEVERELPRYGTVGQSMPYTVRLKNTTHHLQRGLALWEDLADSRPSFATFINQPEPGEARRNAFDRAFGYYRWKWLLKTNQRATIRPWTVPDLAPGDTVELHGEMKPTRRGRLELEGVTVSWPDPFGLCRSLCKLNKPQSLLILPRRYPVPRFPLPGTQEYQPGGVSLARSQGDSEEFVGVRDYRSGDPLRHIHWRSWARAGRPIVREFQEEYLVRHGLVLDTHRPGGADEVFEEAVSVAASFACTVDDDDSLLDLLFVGAEAYCFTAGRGLAHPEQMLEVLACVMPCEDQPFEKLETLVMRHAASMSGCVCVFLDWDEPRRQLVACLKGMGIQVRVFVIRSAGMTETDVEAGFEVRTLEVGKVASQLEQNSNLHSVEVGR